MVVAASASASAVGDVSARQAIFLVAKFDAARNRTARERSIWGKRTRILIVASVSPDCRAAEGDATNLLVQIAPRRAADLHLLLQLLQRLDQCCESFCRHHGLGAGSAEKLRPQGSLPPPEPRRVLRIRPRQYADPGKYYAPARGWDLVTTQPWVCYMFNGARHSRSRRRAEP